jgi:hypothetical protein
MGGLRNNHVVCLSFRLCVPPLITFEKMVEFHQIQHGVRAIESDFDSIIFNQVASTIVKW